MGYNNNKSGNRRSNRRGTNQYPISHFKCIPRSWLSVAETGKPLLGSNNLYFIPMKTPLPEFLTKSLKNVNPWTPAKAIDRAKKLLQIQSNLHFLAINVSQGNEIISEQDWQDVGASYARSPVPKLFEQNSIDAFCEIINKELSKFINTNETLVCLVYCGCGHNRVGFCITSYLTRACKIELSEALKRVDKSSPFLIYQQKPLDTLSTVFKTSPPIHGPPPDGVNPNEIAYPIAEINLPFEKYNGLNKISKRVLPPDEKVKILSILSEACNDPDVLDGYFPKIERTYWSANSLNELRNEEYMISFEPRGLRSFLVVNAESQVFLVIPVFNMSINYQNPNILASNMDTRCLAEVYELKAKSNLKPIPTAVAAAYLIEERKRAVIMTTDLLSINNVNVTRMRLTDRLAFLFYRFNKYLKFENPNVVNDQQNQLQPQQPQQMQQTYQIYFMFRPMTPLHNAKKLYNDISLSSFFVNCDGITFSPVNREPLNTIYLPINPSVILLFDYNGNDKSILYARNDQNNNNNAHVPISERTYPLKPIAIYNSKNSKFNALNKRTSRFEIDKKQEWAPVSIGHNDPPTTTSELKSLSTFLKSNPSYENIFKEIDTIVNQSGNTLVSPPQNNE